MKRPLPPLFAARCIAEHWFVTWPSGRVHDRTFNQREIRVVDVSLTLPIPESVRPQRQRQHERDDGDEGQRFGGRHAPHGRHRLRTENLSGSTVSRIMAVPLKPTAPQLLDVIGPLIGAHLDVVAATVIPAIDQHAANTGIAHFPEGDFLRVGGHRVSCNLIAI